MVVNKRKTGNRRGIGNRTKTASTGNVGKNIQNNVEMSMLGIWDKTCVYLWFV